VFFGLARQAISTKVNKEKKKEKKKKEKEKKEEKEEEEEEGEEEALQQGAALTGNDALPEVAPQGETQQGEATIEAENPQVTLQGEAQQGEAQQGETAEELLGLETDEE